MTPKDYPAAKIFIDNFLLSIMPNNRFSPMYYIFFYFLSLLWLEDIGDQGHLFVRFHIAEIRVKVL